MRQSPGLRSEVFIRAVTHRFDTQTLPLLPGVLQELDARTTLQPIYNAGEIQLNIRGETLVGGYRFTAPAFRQLASALCPGAREFIPTMAGTVLRKTDTGPLLVDGQLSIDIWNRLVDLRLPKLSNHRLIRNDRDRTIEGATLFSCAYFENHLFYQTVQDAIQAAGLAVVPYAAMLAGRQLSAWWRDPQPSFSVTVGGEQHTFHTGYYFSSGEVTGRSVRGTFALYTPYGVALGPYGKYGSRITHIAKNFDMRFAVLCSTVLRRTAPVERLWGGAQRLLQTALGFKAEWSAETRQEHIPRVAKILASLGIAPKYTEDVVRLALTQNHAKNHAEMDYLQVQSLYSTRTLYHLFGAVISRALQLDPHKRERWEQVGFELLTSENLKGVS